MRTLYSHNVCVSSSYHVTTHDRLDACYVHTSSFEFRHDTPMHIRYDVWNIYNTHLSYRFDLQQTLYMIQHDKFTHTDACYMCTTPRARICAHTCTQVVSVSPRSKAYLWKSAFIRHHHHSEGVVYRSFCLNSSTLAVSETASRRWWCIEPLFPYLDPSGLQRAPLAHSLTKVGSARPFVIPDPPGGMPKCMWPTDTRYCYTARCSRHDFKGS